MIQSMRVTQSASSDEYVIQVNISSLTLYRLSREKLLGIEFKKNKYKFANELADILAHEISVLLMQDFYDR